MATIAGLLVVALDLALVFWARYPEVVEGRAVLAVIALVAQIRLVRGDLASLGLLLTPHQGWWWWARVSLLIGVAVGVFIIVMQGAWVLAGQELPVHTLQPSRFGAVFLPMCVVSPVLEEIVYRLAPCVPLAVLLGPRGAIIVSGLLFAALHVVAGVPSPENLVGGFFLAWAYLKSGTIVVPVLLHSLGNLCAMLAQVGAWYWMSGAV